MKVIEFVSNKAKKEFDRLPDEIKEQFVVDLNAIAQGEDPYSDIEPLSGYRGVIELKENGSPAYRCVYCAKHMDVVFVLHSWVKTTNGVDRRAMKTVGDRFKLLQDAVQERTGRRPQK